MKDPMPDGAGIAHVSQGETRWLPKEDASSPTVATEAVLLSCIINAEEGRDVAVIDIPNAFIQT
jgi:hypothetical protein